MKTLENTKVLITAGPTWVPIDSVRVITNIFKGTLGLIVAEEATKKGARVTLLLGPASPSIPSSKSAFKVIRFKFFDDLYKIMEREISAHKYDVVIHSAAVADYTPTEYHDGKMSSGKTDLIITLKPTPKIVDQIKKWDSGIFLVKFKVESNVDREELVRIARESMLASNADLIVANDLRDIGERTHAALIIDLDGKIVTSTTKEEIAKNLLDIIAQRM